MTCDTSPKDIGLDRFSEMRFTPFDWLFQKPHMVLWSDEILMSRPAYDGIMEVSGANPSRGAAYGRAIDTLVDEKIVKVFDPTSYVTKELAELIAAQVERDAARWKNPAPDADYSESVRIGDSVICPPHMVGAYADLAIARQLDAGLLQSDRDRQLCERRFGEIAKFSNVQAFNGVLESLIPDIHILGKYARQSWKEGKESCSNCAQQDACKSKCMEDTERNLGDTLELRNTDEMLQVKKVIVNAISDVRKVGRGDVGDVLREVKHEASICRKRMRTTFPKVQRWLNVSTSLSVAASFIGNAFGESLVGLGATASAASSVVTGECLGFLSSKYQWVDFLEEFEPKVPGLKNKTAVQRISAT